MYKTIYLVGAFDRHNYGDILFPMIHTSILTSHGVQPDQIKYAAVSSSDMRRIGGYETIPIQQLLAQPQKPDTLIVLCGGDILSADWLLMLGNLSTPLVNKLFRVGRKIFGIAATNVLARKLLGQINYYPYIVSKLDTGASIIYTAVGGAGFNGNEPHTQKVVDLLKTCESVSVRDNDVRNLLSRFGLQPKLIPDTALPMSRIYPKEFLAGTDWKSKVNTSAAFSFDKYYSFQGAKRLLSDDVPHIVAQMKRVFDATGYAPLFVPIGRAADHEDHIPLERIFDALKADGYSCGILNSEHVLDIMAALAFAKCYIGTSLHGAITTYSFGKKVIAVKSNAVPKLKDFLNTWVHPKDFYLSNDCGFEQPLIEIIQVNSVFFSAEQLENQMNQVTDEIVHREITSGGTAG
jgi:hypothetical protein